MEEDDGKTHQSRELELYIFTTDGKDVKINLKSCAVELSRPLLTNALKELFDLYHLINDVSE